MSDVHKAAIRYRTGYTETYEQRTGRRCMYGGALDFRKNGQVHLCGSRLRYPPKTRGELRTLARALGITLTEAKQ